jgi:hypothetical protein
MMFGGATDEATSRRTDPAYPVEVGSLVESGSA